MPVAKKRTAADAEKKVEAPFPTTIHKSDLARLLGITERWIDKLVEEGVLAKLARGKYSLRSAVQAFIKYKADNAKQAASSSGSADRLRDTREQQIAQRIAKEERRLISLDEAENSLTSLVAEFGAVLDGLPARLTSNGEERRRIREILDDERDKLSRRLAEEAHSLRTGQPAAEADEEDDV